MAQPPPGITALRILGGTTCALRRGLGFILRANNVRPKTHFYLIELKLFALQNVTLAGLQVERRIYESLEV